MKDTQSVAVAVVKRLSCADGTSATDMASRYLQESRGSAWQLGNMIPA